MYVQDRQALLLTRRNEVSCCRRPTALQRKRALCDNRFFEQRYSMAEVTVHSVGKLRQQINVGACTSMTLLMYARRKLWPLEDVAVKLSHRRDYARDCEDCDRKPVQIDVIERRITLVGPLDAEQRLRLLEIAKKCPVHRTLTGTIS